MALGPRLDLRQSQSLVMTPQLQQAIKLLALSNLELESYLAEALDANPLLEAGSGDIDYSAPDEVDREGPDFDVRDFGGAEGGDDPDYGASDESDEQQNYNEAASLDVPMADRAMDSAGGLSEELDVDFTADQFHHDSASDTIGVGAASAADADGLDFDSFAATEQSLHSHLLAQAGEVLSSGDQLIAQQIIALIDEAGYWRGEPSEVAEMLGVSMDDVQRVLGAVQSFDPIGVGARDLRECIALQAREADRYDPCMAVMIANLDLVAKGAFAQLKRICGVDDEDLADMIRELRGYDPKPGLRFGGGTAQMVVPDIFVRQISGGWVVEMNSATLPRVLVNRRYYQQLSLGAGKKNRSWLSEQLAGANWLVRALDQRQRTIMKVTSEIVKQQEGFFLHGVSQMKPLTLRQVADAISMHESTVSRVTSHKYISCPRGLFELKYFFSSGISASDGDGAVSAEAVKSRIRALIEGEGAKAILSDEVIAKKLAEEGFDIARRTVVKYREAMGFGSSVQRRRQKALAG
ncbi:RNA polymerase factor sigma-54 [Sphingopyxis yananensis]|uniref:RNA polymerase factor sigma-54 n=1 Tax=Sphingopyxis yananensis TaxID=2886687 RepID=UPI001D0FA2C5|nr:RNA polymerase factor sigma-54 [Sphingopyxis yananensis]MCC2601316.1 RNA polymerase factor sigma-54 [Sphingopyxis yananensis]